MVSYFLLLLLMINLFLISGRDSVVKVNGGKDKMCLRSSLSAEFVRNPFVLLFRPGPLAELPEFSR